VSTGAPFVKFDASSQFLIADSANLIDTVRGFEATASWEPHFVTNAIETTEGVISLQMALTRRSGDAKRPVFDGLYANGNQLGRLQLTLVETAKAWPVAHRARKASYGHIIPEADLEVVDRAHVNKLVRGLEGSKPAAPFVTTVSVTSRYGGVTTQFAPVRRSVRDGQPVFEGLYANGNELGGAFLTIGSGSGGRFETKRFVDTW
jgi:hypothetical protein